MVRACACIVAALLASGCGQRGPLVLPQNAAGTSVRRPVPPLPASITVNVPLSPSIPESPDPNASAGGDTGPDGVAPAGDAVRP